MGRTMAICELRCDSSNDYAALVPSDHGDVVTDVFDADGRPMHRPKRPRVSFYVGKRKKTQKPRADVSLLLPGALVLNKAALQALGGFLSRLGQLLELDCEGETRYFFNATNMISCITQARSKKFEGGGIMLEAFDESKAPSEPSVFKDPLTAPIRISVNDSGKQLIARIVAETQLTGIECGSPRPICSATLKSRTTGIEISKVFETRYGYKA